MNQPAGVDPVSAGVVPESQASGKAVNCEVRTEVSQTAVSVLILRLRSGQAKQKLHTEAIRSDEVPHAAEVQSLSCFLKERTVPK